MWFLEKAKLPKHRPEILAASQARVAGLPPDQDRLTHSWISHLSAWAIRLSPLPCRLGRANLVLGLQDL